MKRLILAALASICFLLVEAQNYTTLKSAVNSFQINSSFYPLGSASLNFNANYALLEINYAYPASIDPLYFNKIIVQNKPIGTYINGNTLDTFKRWGQIDTFYSTYMVEQSGGGGGGGGGGIVAIPTHTITCSSCTSFTFDGDTMVNQVITLSAASAACTFTNLLEGVTYELLVIHSGVNTAWTSATAGLYIQGVTGGQPPYSTTATRDKYWIRKSAGSITLDYLLNLRQ